MRLINRVGHRYGRLVVVRRAENNLLGKARWHCKCDCGACVVVSGGKLQSGYTQSCGCLRRDLTTTHGMTRSREFIVWQRINSRCHYKRATGFHLYGGRGIRVCDEWRGRGGFEKFFAHIGTRPSPKHQIDRINNDGNYEPGNVRWATSSQNNKNRRDKAERQSDFYGVSWRKSDQKWRGSFWHNDKNVHVGLFADEHAANRAVRKAMKQVGKRIATCTSASV